MSDIALAAPLAGAPVKRRDRISSVEFWRFIFTLLVMWYHMEGMSGMRVSIFTSGSSAVEFFFVLAGFTAAMSAYGRLSKGGAVMSTREAASSAFDYVKKKIIAILPVLIVLLAFWILFLVKPSGSETAWAARLRETINSEWRLLFMVGTPFGGTAAEALTDSSHIPLWFLTALIVIGYLYTFLVNKFPHGMRFAAPLIGVLGYIFYALSVVKNGTSYYGNIMESQGFFGNTQSVFLSPMQGSFSTLDFQSLMGVLNSGMVKALAEMGFGVSIYFIYERVSKTKVSAIWSIFLSLFEIYVIYRFFSLTIGRPLGYENVRRIIYIMLIVLLSFMNVTLISRILNLKPLRRIWNYIGGVSLTMYLTHLYWISPYTSFIGKMKDKYTVKSSIGYKFFSDMGGGMKPGAAPNSYDMNNMNNINTMSWKDMIAFALLVFVFSVLVYFFIKLWKKFVSQPFALVVRNSKLGKPLRIFE